MLPLGYMHTHQIISNVQHDYDLRVWRALVVHGAERWRINRLATMPVLEDVIPLAIVSGFAVGLGFILAVFIK